MRNFFRGLKFTLPLALIFWALLVWLGLTIHNVAQADDVQPTPKTEWVYQGAALADMLTTLDIKRHPVAKIVETNPFLGSRPSDAKVLGYFAATGALHWLITRELVNENVPLSVINAWEYVSIGIETGVMAHNFSIGLRFKL